MLVYQRVHPPTPTSLSLKDWPEAREVEFCARTDSGLSGSAMIQEISCLHPQTWSCFFLLITSNYHQEKIAMISLICDITMILRIDIIQLLHMISKFPNYQLNHPFWVGWLNHPCEGNPIILDQYPVGAQVGAPNTCVLNSQSGWSYRLQRFI